MGIAINITGNKVGSFGIAAKSLERAYGAGTPAERDRKINSGSKMHTRQWMVTHDWMVKGNRQTEWIDKRGILLWLAFYSGGLGGGLYLVSLFFNNFWGMVIGWLIVAVIKGSFHFAFLGKPARFWRMVIRPQTSWLSRGLLFVLVFGLTGLIQIILSGIMPGSDIGIAFKIVSGVSALAVATYTGFVLNDVKGVPLWNPNILPLLFVAGGVLGGFGLTVAMGLFTDAVDLHLAEAGSRWLLILDAVIVGTYLIIVARKNETGKQSVFYQLNGNLAGIFWGGVVAVGVVIPLFIAFFSNFAGEAAAVSIIFAVICEVMGGMLLRYCLLKSAIHQPLISRSVDLPGVRGKRQVLQSLPRPAAAAQKIAAV